MRERIAYLFMIGILILLMALVFGVLGKGEYKTASPKKEGITQALVFLPGDTSR